MEYKVGCLEGCSPAQVINLLFAINDISTVKVYNNCDIGEESEKYELIKNKVNKN